MFKKAGDNVHYLERTGSHSTKGSRRGVDHMAPLTSEDFNSEQNIIGRRREIRYLRKLISIDIAQATQVKAAMLDAAESGNTELMDVLLPIMKDLNERIRAKTVERDELKRVTPKKLHRGRRPDFDERKLAALLRHQPIWWDEASDWRKKKYLKWLKKLGAVDETKFR